jgi:tetratricopeptide (TPR) repeat protein
MAMYRWMIILLTATSLSAGDLGAMLRLQEKAAAALLAWKLDPGAEPLRQAEAAITAAELAQPGNPVNLRLRGELHLARREFREAKEAAVRFNRQVPDDLDGYRLIVEACLALGCYAEAEKAGQWMLDLRAKDPLSLRAAARMRELWGDFDGAGDALTQALQRIQPQQVAERASVLAHMSRLELAQGRLEAAARLSEQARELAPRLAETMEPGDADGWERVEALLQTQRKAEALALAESEFSQRQDVRTRTALAWALAENGQPQRAWEHFTKVLETGFRDAVVFYRAGCVAHTLGRKAESRRLWQKSLDLNPHSTVAKQAGLRLDE